MKKKCKRCGIVKDITEYHKAKTCLDGHRSVCKECRNKHYRDWRANEEVREFIRKDSRERYRRNRDVILERSRAYSRTPKGRENSRKAQQRRKEKYPEKFWCRQKTVDARRSGELVRGNCEICGTDKNIEAHHEDYSKPLEVTWLCHYCHRKVEGRLIKRAEEEDD